MRGARLGGRAAVGRGQAGVRRLGPGVAAVEREVHAAKPNAEVEGAERERAGRVLSGRRPRARLHVDQVVGPGGEHVRPDGADRQRGLVLGILWVVVGGAADTDQSVSSRCGMRRRRAYGAQRKDNGRHQGSSRGTHSELLSARPRSGRAKRSPHRWPVPGQSRQGVSLGARRRFWTPSPPSRRAAVGRSATTRARGRTRHLLVDTLGLLLVCVVVRQRPVSRNGGAQGTQVLGSLSPYEDPAGLLPQQFPRPRVPPDWAIGRVRPGRIFRETPAADSRARPGQPTAHRGPRKLGWRLTRPQGNPGDAAAPGARDRARPAANERAVGATARPLA